MDTSLLKEELTSIPIWVKLHDVPLQGFEEDDISLIVTFIGKPVMLDSYTSSMCNDSWGRSSFDQCLIEVNSEADLVDVVTIGIPSLIGDDFTKETIRVEYEWRSPRKKGKSMSTNGGPSVKQTVRYEPKATTSAPKKRATNVGNSSKSSYTKTTITSTKKGNIATFNHYSALEDESDEDVENIYDESANLFQSTVKVHLLSRLLLWYMNMEKEEVTAVALGSFWVAAATSLKYLRIFSMQSVQMYTFLLDGPVVTASGYEDELAVVTHSSQSHEHGLEFRVFNIANETQPIRGLLPLSNGSSLTWFGFSEQGQIGCFDSMGVFRLLTYQFGGIWLEVFRAGACKEVKKGHTCWIVGFDSGKLYCILCKHPDEFPKMSYAGGHTVLGTSISVASHNLGNKELESSLIFGKMEVAEMQRRNKEKKSMDRVSNWMDDEIKKKATELDESILFLFLQCCKAKNHDRAHGLASHLSLQNSAEIAIGYATQHKMEKVSSSLRAKFGIPEETTIADYDMDKEAVNAREQQSTPKRDGDKQVDKKGLKSKGKQRKSIHEETTIGDNDMAQKQAKDKQVDKKGSPTLKTVSKAGQSSMARDGSLFVYNPNVVREQFAGLVIQEGLPFDNSRMTRVFQNHLQPKYNHSHSRNPMTNLLNKLKENSNKRAKNDRLTSSEYERYIASDFVSNLSTEELAGYDVLGFWKSKESTFPVLSRMARDILSVQATSIASESAFSTSGRVLSIRRTRLTPTSFEMCMCLNDHLDTTERIQHISNLKNSLDFKEEILDEEVLENEAIALSDEEIALDDEAASEARSNGSGGEEFDMTMFD
ncbi:zinc finger BED domain-containing protein RICESLEEPER 2 [Tanacetum coccineum]